MNNSRIDDAGVWSDAADNEPEDAPVIGSRDVAASKPVDKRKKGKSKDFVDKSNETWVGGDNANGTNGDGSNPALIAAIDRRDQRRDRVRGYVVAGLMFIVVALIIVYIVAAWTLGENETQRAAWEHVNAVAGLALASFLTLLGTAIGWYFSESKAT